MYKVSPPLISVMNSSKNYQFDNTIKELTKLKSYFNVIAIVEDWLIIFGTFYYVSNNMNTLTYLIAVIIIGSRQHSLGVISHDVVHHRLLQSKKWGEIIGNLVLSWPLFFTIPGFRSMHLRHHSKVNTDDDPDWVRRKGKADWIFPMSKTKLYTMLVCDITGINLYQNIQKIFLPKSDKKLFNDFKKVPKIYYLFMALFYIAAFSTIHYFDFWIEFLVLWVVPYMTWLKFIKRLRAIGEHFAIPNIQVQEWTRTTYVNPIERFFIAPRNINYHVEHHQFPAVPWYNLKKLNRYLVKTNQLVAMGHTSHGYLRDVLRESTEYCQLNAHIKL